MKAIAGEAMRDCSMVTEAEYKGTVQALSEQAHSILRAWYNRDDRATEEFPRWLQRYDNLEGDAAEEALERHRALSHWNMSELTKVVYELSECSYPADIETSEWPSHVANEDALSENIIFVARQVIVCDVVDLLEENLANHYGRYT